MNIKEVLRKVGEKSAVNSITARCIPFTLHQPKPPSSIQKLIEKSKQFRL